jgi:DNA-binding MarR family transcriptional regulator
MIEGRIPPTAGPTERHPEPCICSMVDVDDQGPIALAREAAWRMVHLLSLLDGGGTSESGRSRNSIEETDLEIAQRVAHKRAERDILFGSGIFTDPAWDILLDLFIAGERGQKISVSSVCIASRVPSTSALRWLKELESRKIITREPDEYDRRRSFIMLTAGTRSKITGLLRGLNASIL